MPAPSRRSPDAAVELVIFDCDGVLVDSEVIVIEVEAELLTAGGFPVTADEIADRFVGLSYADMTAVLEAEHGRRLPASLHERIREEALLAFEARLEPVRGMADVLAGLATARCVASSSGLDRIRRSLALTGLAGHFGADHLFSSSMVPNGKPAPDLFLHAAARMGVDPAACLVIEDSPHGVSAAVSAGMPVAGFVGGGHARPSLRGRLQRAGADVVVDDARELPVPR